MKKPAVLSLLVVAATVLLAACHPSASGEDPASVAVAREAALAPRDVRLITPAVREERPTLELVGEVRPFDSVAVSSEVAGRVDRVLVEVGDRVREGQPLAEIDRSTYRLHLTQVEAQLAAAKADLDLAAKDLERKKDLLSDQTISQAAFDQASAAHDLARARVAAAEAARDLARRNFDRSVVRAPAAGAVTLRVAVGGQYADVGKTLFELALGDVVKVAAEVPAEWAARLSDLEGFDFKAGLEGTPRRARLYSVDPTVNASNRSFEVVGLADNREGALRPGMFATVTLSSPEATRSLWLPAAAVATSDMYRVLQVAEGKVAPHDVEVGRREEDQIEVLRGLAEGDQVIADVAGLSRGIPVRVVGETEAGT